MLEPHVAVLELVAAFSRIGGEEPIASITVTPDAFNALKAHYAPLVGWSAEGFPLRGPTNRLQLAGVTIRKGARA